MQRVERRICDRRVLKLLRKWIQAGVMDEGRLTEMVSGTPQGGVISPLLSNVYRSKSDVLGDGEHVARADGLRREAGS